jgi:hypothetical protein
MRSFAGGEQQKPRQQDTDGADNFAYFFCDNLSDWLRAINYPKGICVHASCSDMSGYNRSIC